MNTGERLVVDTSLIESAMRDAEEKAWEALSGYKFWMFGYHAARWINYSRLHPERHPNPFSSLVRIARGVVDKGSVSDA